MKNRGIIFGKVVHNLLTLISMIMRMNSNWPAVFNLLMISTVSPYDTS